MKNLKTLSIFAATVLFIGLFSACGNKDKTDEADNKLGKMEVVIPDELKDNPELVDYIKGMSEVVDEYALLMDDMIDEMDGIQGKDWDELKLGEQLKVTKTAAKFAMKAAPITAKWAEYEAKRNVVYEDLSDEDLMAMETLMTRFENRMKQIEEKNQEFFGNADV